MPILSLWTLQLFLCSFLGEVQEQHWKEWYKSKSYPVSKILERIDHYYLNVDLSIGKINLN